MPSDIHNASWHLLDTVFPAVAEAAPSPRRNNAGTASLRIANFDRDQAAALALTAAPSLPTIPVACEIAGFDPAAAPIRWRMRLRHVARRFVNQGGYRYRPEVRVLEREWRGESRTASFTLFDAGCACTYNDGARVMGGDGVIEVAAALPDGVLSDFVPVRVTGTNPSAADVQAWLDARLTGCDPNLVRMARAVFAHEASYRQFATTAQTAVSMNFTQRQHNNPAQPDCRVHFDWPDDPPGFPLASFDFGVGIAQWTHPEELTPDIAWDWRENVRTGVALFLDGIRRTFRPGMTWMDWALAAWAAYNGRGSGAAAYAAQLASGAEGVLVSKAAVTGSPMIARLDPPPPLADPGVWLA